MAFRHGRDGDSSRRSRLDALDPCHSIEGTIERCDPPQPEPFGGCGEIRLGEVEPQGLVELDGPEQQSRSSRCDQRQGRSTRSPGIAKSSTS
jgi:hypothetical protein